MTTLKQINTVISATFPGYDIKIMGANSTIWFAKASDDTLILMTTYKKLSEISIEAWMSEVQKLLQETSKSPTQKVSPIIIAKQEVMTKEKRMEAIRRFVAGLCEHDVQFQDCWTCMHAFLKDQSCIESFEQRFLARHPEFEIPLLE